jgi:ribosomal protein L30E
MEYITASCIISDNVVYTNGKTVFEPPSASDQDFLLSVYQHIGIQYPKFYKMDNLSKLGWLTCELLLREGFRSADYQQEEVAVVLSNANASLDTDYKYYATVKEIPSPAVFVYTLPNIMIGEICIRHHFKGENAFFVSESFNATLLAQYVHSLMDSGGTRACICGWVDVLGDEYKAALFLIEKAVGTTDLSPGVTPLSAENINHLFQITTRHE